MNNPGLLFSANKNNFTSIDPRDKNMSKNFQNKMNDKGFLDFEDLL